MKKGMPNTPPLLQLWQLLHGMITVELQIQLGRLLSQIILKIKNTISSGN